MSIWADMHKVSTGETVRKEDDALIYNPDLDKDEEIFTDVYNENKYTIYTTGKFPYIMITMKYPGGSVFSGYNLVKMKRRDGKFYDLDRVVSNGQVNYSYFFNADGDYVEGKHDGKKYNLPELKSTAVEFIDLIMECEDKL